MSISLSILPETAQEIELKSSRELVTAKALVVDSNDKYVAAIEYLKTGIKALQKEIEDTFNGPISKAYFAHKAMVTAKNKHMEPLIQAETIVKQKTTAWWMEQEQIRITEERKLAEEARKREEERLLQEATEASTNGNADLAEEILREAVEVETPVIKLESLTPKISGLSFRDNWQFRIINMRLIPFEYMVPDLVKIGKVVKAMKESANIPGIQVYNNKTSMVR